MSRAAGQVAGRLHEVDQLHEVVVHVAVVLLGLLADVVGIAAREDARGVAHRPRGGASSPRRRLWMGSSSSCKASSMAGGLRVHLAR